MIGETGAGQAGAAIGLSEPPPPWGSAHRPSISADLNRALASALVLGLLVPIVVGGAQRLPVGPVPHQLGITLVGDDVVDDRCDGHPTLLLAHDAERMLSEEYQALTLPLATVSTGRGLGAMVVCHLS